MATLVHADMTSLGRMPRIRRTTKQRASIDAPVRTSGAGWGTAGPVLLFLAGLMLMRLGAAEVMAHAPTTLQTIETGTLAGD